MSADDVSQLSGLQAFAPRTRFHELAIDHLPFDELVGEDHYEQRALDSLIDADRSVVVVGGRGGGKSSLIAHVCGRLPDEYIALRVPVTGADEPADVSAVAAIALSTALSGLDLAKHQRRDLEVSRADHAKQTRLPRRVGGRLLGGALPAEVTAELRSLGTEITTNRLAGERLAGLDRLVTILTYRKITPVFVMEDTEAVISAPDGGQLADGFFRGPVKAFMTEVDATLLLAVQSHIAQESAGFAEIAPGLRRVDIPDFGSGAAGALTEIMAKRLADHELSCRVHDVVAADALAVLVAWYAECGCSLRLTLAALQSAVDHAADAGAERILSMHMLAAASDWR